MNEWGNFVLFLYYNRYNLTGLNDPQYHLELLLQCPYYTLHTMFYLSIYSNMQYFFKSII